MHVWTSRLTASIDIHPRIRDVELDVFVYAENFSRVYIDFLHNNIVCVFEFWTIKDILIDRAREVRITPSRNFGRIV